MIVAAIPAFDEEATIARVVIGSRRHVDKVLVCDNGSSDMTGEIAEKLGAEVVRHERNLGKGAAVRSLFDFAKKLRNRKFMAAGSTQRQLNLCCGMIPNNGCMVF